jgi:hypothetical protein
MSATTESAIRIGAVSLDVQSIQAFLEHYGSMVEGTFIND